MPGEISLDTLVALEWGRWERDGGGAIIIVQQNRLK